MSIYERGLANLRTAKVPTIKQWISDRVDGEYFTPLDSDYTSSRVETASLLGSLYENSDENVQLKLRMALDILLQESVDQQKYSTLTEIIFIIGQIGYKFPFSVLIDFLVKNTTSDLEEIKSDALALLQGYIQDSPIIREKYHEWYWADSITLGKEHALQLFAGLITDDPISFPKLLIHLDHINETLSPDEQFEKHWVWGVIVDHCTEAELQEGLPQLPNKLSNQLQELRAEDSDLFSCEN